MSQYDVAVAYRIYPGMPKQALRQFGEKSSSAETCLRSFCKSLGSLRARVWAILDGCPDHYETMVSKCFSSEDLEIVRCEKIGNSATFALQREILEQQSNSEYVYFAEDDYLYRPGQLERVIGFLAAHEDVDFVTPYDHPDAYNLPLSMSRASLRIWGGMHWQTVSSTCLTFATRRSTLRSTKTAFATYNLRNYDASIWHSLTKRGLCQWVAHPVSCARSPNGMKTMGKTFLYGWKQILFGRRYTLWSPIPSAATHLQEGGLAPNINWFESVGHVP